LPVISILSRIPILNYVGSYGMYASLVILFCVCLLSAIGFEKILNFLLFHKKNHKKIMLIIEGCLIGLTLTGIIYSSFLAISIYGALFPLKTFSERRENFFQVADQVLYGVINRYREVPPDQLLSNQYYNIRRGVGTITWLGNLQFLENAKPKYLVGEKGNLILQKDYSGEIYCLNFLDNSCSVNDYEISYNTIHFIVQTSLPSTVVINLNYSRGWNVRKYNIQNHNGLIAVVIPAGVQEVINLNIPILLSASELSYLFFQES
jgi:hypothetical protein